MIDRMVDDAVRTIFDRAGRTGSRSVRSLARDAEFGPRAGETVVPSPVVEAAARPGPTGSVVVRDPRSATGSIGQEGGHTGRAEAVPRSARASAKESAGVGARLPAAWPPTPDTVTPLRLLRTGRPGPLGACVPVGARAARQLTRHRIASAFRTPVRVAAESGGPAGIVRNEVGVVSFPDGRRYAAAVFTRSRPGSDDAAADAAVGAVTARAIASPAHRTI
ncbi:serine hydrolase [Streptomyces misionensis]|uniref:Serine hydrolase n=1 Tax=Streptomyces misionensis TaxID=67331 RepID=A0A5C6IYD9_9ACTN|nr:serine hydrolase [Streptomyces misionensis]TWV33871.1 serine hydrolase [Streptomyces misionensis]